ncbi:MAG: class I SAM-dependent RNA methyltransferase [Acidobacteria bacterium]|nr:class I SAM-dependent RNA methyltransferase [Acidobacteriota bacterium]
MLQPGTEVVLSVEKPAAGGRMIARHHGEVVLVSGTLPGEQVRARIEQAGRGVVWASTIDVLEPSPDRRPVLGDPACGGQVYLHVAYERQLALKAAVVADAFARIARLPLAAAVKVTPSPTAGYRMRARLHVRAGVIGFFREGTHEMCDPAGTGQLLPDTTDLLARLSYRMRADHIDLVNAIELAENIPATERALHLQIDGPIPPEMCAALLDELPVTGVAASRSDRPDDVVLRGTPIVTDTLEIGGRAGSTCAPVFRRHVQSFFQANRFLVPALVSRVLALVPPGPVVDLYAGVGLFAISLAATGRSGVTAVEGDRTSAEDLRANAKPWGTALQAHAMPVEQFLRSQRPAPEATLIVDPPRTGMSRDASAGIIASGAARLVFVSCDVATLARDVRKLVDAGYALEHLEAFDLFPNTAHVEAVAVLTRAGR